MFVKKQLSIRCFKSKQSLDCIFFRFPDAYARGKHSAWTSTAPNQAEARTHYKQRRVSYKAPSGRELAPKATEGERVTIKLIKTPKSRRLLPPLSRSPSLSEGGFGKPPPTKKHHQGKFLGGVRVFSAKHVETNSVFFVCADYFFMESRISRRRAACSRTFA